MATTLTSQQHQVITLLAAGAPVTDAAAQAGLHRTTIHHWLRTSPLFKLTLDQARREHADLLRTGLGSLADDAVAALRTLLTAGDTSPSVRLRAATTVLRALGADRLPATPSDTEMLDAVCAPPPDQPDPALLSLPGVVEPTTVAHPTPVHHPSSPFIAQTAPHRAAPIPPRNAPCPCGSQRKYKHCCHLAKPAAAAAAA